MPCDVLAKWLADNNQVYTQHAYMRVMAVETMLIGINDDDEDNKKPMLYKVRSRAPTFLPVSFAFGAGWTSADPLWLSSATSHLTPPRQVDPAGYYAGYHASCAGTKEIECTNWLEKKMKAYLGESKKPLSMDQAVRLGISALQSVLSEDFKASQLEVGVISCESSTFRKLSEDEIDDHLVAISERD